MPITPLNIANRLRKVPNEINSWIQKSGDYINSIVDKENDPERLGMLNTPTNQYNARQKTLAKLNPSIEDDKSKISEAQGILDRLVKNKTAIDNDYLKFYQSALGEGANIQNDIKKQTKNLVEGSGIEEARQKGFAVGQATGRGATQAMKGKIIDDVTARGIAERLKTLASQQAASIQARTNQQNLLMGVGQQLQQQKQQDLSNQLAREQFDYQKQQANRAATPTQTQTQTQTQTPSLLEFIRQRAAS